MSHHAVLFFVVVGAILLALVWTLYLIAGLMLGLTAFALCLPVLLFVLMFIMAPPPFIVLLLGGFIVLFGLVGRRKPSDSNKPNDRASKSGQTYIESKRSTKE